MNFQVGDKIRIRSEKDLINEYGRGYCFPPEFPFGMAPQMRLYLGAKAKIINVESSEAVNIDIDHGGWRWHPDWLYKE